MVCPVLQADLSNSGSCPASQDRNFLGQGGGAGSRPGERVGIVDGSKRKGRGWACQREVEAEAGQSPRQTFFPYSGAGAILLATAPALWLLLRMQYELGPSMN